MLDAIGERVKSIIEKYIEHKTLDGEHQISGTSTLHGRMDHLEAEAQKEDDQQEEMVQSIDNDIQRECQTTSRNDGGNQWWELPAHCRARDRCICLSAVTRRPMAHHPYCLHIYIIVTTHCSVAYTSTMDLVNEKKTLIKTATA